MVEQKELLSIEALAHAAECLKTIAHPVRLKMIQMLLREDITVGDLADACKIKQNVASEHLRLMQHCGLMKSNREGRKVYYKIAEPHLASIMECIEKRFSEMD